MTVQIEHEHLFVGHEDPRWLYCDCGQFAVRARNIAGDRIIRLIDPPKPAFVRLPCDVVAAGCVTDVRQDHLVRPGRTGPV